MRNRVRAPTLKVMACGGSRANLRSVEALTERISELVAKRQELRRSDASLPAIERNRLEIARAQWDLSHALIERYLPSPSRTAA
ncbi:MAG TPA: hypothetical protein VLU96_11160 [Gaiellaceae bacterium]|nr:hypothetical protein [Gaiellaceae bacterium]